MGLGKAFATKLLEAGALVCISDVDETTGRNFIIQGKLFRTSK